MNSDNQKTLEEIFRTVLELPDDAQVGEQRRIGNPKWDSLAHTMLVTAIESEFGVTVKIKDAEERMNSYASTKLLLEEMGL